MKQRLNMWRYIVRLTLALGLMAAANAYAAALSCTFSPSTTTTIAFGAVSVPRDAPIGTAIGPLKTTSVTVNCPSNSTSLATGFYLQYASQLPLSTAGSNVWQTSVAGIGIQVISVTYNNMPMSNIGNGSWSNFAPNVPANKAYTGTFTFSYQLIKTAAQASAGTFTGSPMFTLLSHDVPNNGNSTTQPAYNFSANITVPTCTVTTNPINVTLPTLPVSQINPTGGDTPFQIGLDCGQGDGVNVYVTLTDATTTSNQTNQLTLAPGSTASGVALHVLSNGNPVSFGLDSPAANTKNQWRVGPFTNLTSIPLTAQYVSTGAVTPGTVKASATFTLSYQ